MTEAEPIALSMMHQWCMAGGRYLHVPAALLGEAVASASGVQPITIKLLQLSSQAWVLGLPAGQS